MTSMLTVSGRLVSLLSPSTADINISDIAHHLAMIARFSGACRRPYSVAEHSLLVCDIFERAHPTAGPAAKLAALMHDAHEAYTGDAIGPMKQVLRVLAGDAWDVLEARHADCVHRRFGLLAARAAWKVDIKAADNIAYATERLHVAPNHPDRAIDYDRTAVASWVNLSDRSGFAWSDWRSAFSDRYDELRVAITATHADTATGDL